MVGLITIHQKTFKVELGNGVKKSMKCTYCEGVVDVKYRVNQIGDYYCNDECYEKHLDINELSFNDDQHPYIDIYENVRSEYNFWINNWESELQFGMDYLAYINNCIENIDSFIDEYYEYYISDGDDGVFHFEIRRYLHELWKLQVEMINWRPDREVYYTVTLLFDEDAELRILDAPKAVNLLEEKIKIMNLNKEQTDLLLDYINLGENKYDWRCTSCNDVWLTYESLEEAEEVAEAFQKYFSNELSEILIETSYLCDSGCGIYLTTTEAECDLEGWHYAESCAKHDCPGTYSEAQLLELVDKEEDELSLPSDIDWLWFTAKVRRSCILHGIGYPYWALLDE